MSELPQTWVECEMGDVAKIVGGGTPDSQNPENFSTEHGIPWLTPADLSDNKAIHVAGGKRFLTKKGFDNSSARLVPKGTVLFSSRAPIGYVAVAANEISTNQGFKSFVCADGISPEYIYFWLRFATPMAEELASGTTFAEISGKNAAKIPLRLAPLAEQRRIVAKLETLLGKVDASQQRLAKIPVLLRRFRQSVLAAACSGRLTADWREENECSEDADALLERMKVERSERFAAENAKRKYREADPVADEDLPTVPETWRWTNFDHCAWEITVGHVGPMKDRYVEKGVTFLRCQNVKPLRFSPDGLVRIPADFHAQLSKSELLGGEILVVRSGANTGDCCVFPRNLGAANCSDLVITRPLSGLCSEFGALYVNSSAGQALLTQNQTGIAQPHFNIGAMRVKAFPLPPLPEQQEIVRRVEGLFALADQLELRLAKARGHVDKLTPSLLARAFAGQLVPQDPTDESAEKLLERIHRSA